MAAKYRVGIVGCGSTSNFFLNGWAALADRVEVTGLCDILPEQIATRREKHPETLANARGYSDYQEMLEAEPLDIVCLCTHGDHRLEHAEGCLAAGKHLFIEKPVGYNPEEARRFKFLAHKYPEMQVAVAYSLRYLSMWMDMKALLATGVLGELFSAQIAYCHPHDFDQPSKRHSTTDKAGNYIASSQLIHATHPWDMARYLLGEVREVFMASAKRTSMGILWMESGALCHVLAGGMRVAKEGANTHQFAQVHGTKGSAWLMRDIYEPFKCHVRYRTDGDIETAPAVSDIADSSHGVVLRSMNFLDAIEGKAELICSMADGAATTDLLHALWLSQRLQVKVPVLPAGHTG